MKRFLYSIAYLFLLGVPTSVLYYIVWNQLNLGAIALVILSCLLIGGVFDIWAVKQRKNDKFFVWEYNSKSILGFKIYGMPIEDVFLFLVLTPLFIITIYESIKEMLISDDGLLIPLLIAETITLIISWNFVYKHAIKSKY